jgi:ArsR family transcriptional regulator
MPQVAALFKALADPNRLRIVNILSHRDLCVCDLQSVLGLSQPFISRHLAYLRRAGLVKDRREGPRVCYSLALDDALGRALDSLLRAAGHDSLTFQSDLQALLERASAGRLKSGAGRENAEPLASRAA